MVAGWRSLVILGVFLSLARSAPAQPRYDAGNEHYEQVQLPNGLKAYLAEDHRAPLVAIDVRYAIGTLRDPQEARGVAQLIGKLLPALGTSHLPRGAEDLIAAAGFYPWEVKAVVREEDTSLRMVVPAAAVDLALFIEAERMGFAADGLRAEAMWSVSNDLAMSFSKQSGAAGTSGFAAALAYGPTHPLAVLSSKPDFSKVDWRWLHRRLSLYNVGVATLSIAGDFDSQRLRPVIQRTFGALQGRPLPVLPSPPVSTTPRSGELRAADITPASIWSWRTPRYLTPDDITLDVVSRYLKHRLSQQLASSDNRSPVWARQVSLQESSYFYLQLPLVSEAERGTVEQTARAELDAIGSGQLDLAELELAKRTILAEIAMGMDSLAARAHFMTSYASYSGKLDQFDQHLQSYLAVDASRVSDVVRRLLQKPDGSLRLIKDETAIPRRLTGIEPASFAGLDAAEVPASKDSPAWYRPPGAVVQPRFDTPRVVEGSVGKTRFLFMPRAGLPTVRLRVALNWRGPSPSPRSRYLLLSTLLRMHPGGKPVLKDRLADLGATLETSVNDDTLALEATTLVEQADAVMTALRETLEQDQLEQTAFSAARDAMLSNTPATPADTPALLLRWSAQVSYRKGHRYRPGEVDDAARLQALKSLTSKQLEKFWKDERKAQRVTISIVGPIAEARAEELARLGTPRFRAEASAAPAAARAAPHLFLIDAPRAGEVRARFSWPIGAWGSPAFVHGISLKWLLSRNADGGVGRMLTEAGVKNAHDWKSEGTSWRDDSSVGFTVAVPKDEVVGLFKAVSAYVARLQAGDISWAAEQEARRGTVQWMQSYFTDAEHCLGYVSIHADLEVPKQAGDDLYVLSQRIGRPSLARAASVLAPEKATVVVYGAVADLAPSLQNLGFAALSVVSANEEAKP